MDFSPSAAPTENPPLETAEAQGISPPAAAPDWSAAPPAKTARQHHLDALRSILMILGVFLHGSYVYAEGRDWIFKDGDSSRLLQGINEAIHFFRIPCFFILSGFFARMLIERQGGMPFLKMRMKRLALPLLSTAVLFNSMQAYLLHGSRTGAWHPADFLFSGAYAGFWASGEWIGHLWFLVYALAFSAAAAAMPVRLSDLSRPWKALRKAGRFLFLLPLVQVAFFAAAGFLPFLYRHWGGLSPYGLLTYCPFFAFGLLVFLSPRIREEFHRVRAWQVIAVPAAVGLEYGLSAFGGALWARAASWYLDFFLVWFCCVLLFAGARLLLNRPSRTFAYLSEASYSIYLFHHLFVVALAILLAGRHWPVLSKFAVVVGASLAISLGLHHFLVMRVRVLRLLFMGK